MTTLLYSFLLAPILWAQVAETHLWERLQHYTWKNRVIVVYTPVDGSREMQQQLQTLDQYKAGVKERDLMVIQCVNPTLSSEDKNYLNRRFRHNLSQFGVWLIGKDGSIKLSSTQPIPATKLFATIDTMPMRRSEMKRNE